MQADVVRSLNARLSVLLTDAEEADAGEEMYVAQLLHITARSSQAASSPLPGRHQASDSFSQINWGHCRQQRLSRGTSLGLQGHIDNLPHPCQTRAHAGGEEDKSPLALQGGAAYGAPQSCCLPERAFLPAEVRLPSCHKIGCDLLRCSGFSV